MLKYGKTLQINSNAVKEFTLNRRFDYTYLCVYDGVIISAGDSGSRIGFGLTDDEPNWKEAANVLLQFYREDYEAFCEILKLLNRNAEEHKELQSAMEDAIRGITSKLQCEIQDYESLLKRF